MNCELLNCAYVFVYSPKKDKLTSCNPKTSLLNVCICCIRLLSPQKINQHWKLEDKNHPLQWKKEGNSFQSFGSIPRYQWQIGRVLYMIPFLYIWPKHIITMSSWVVTERWHPGFHGLSRCWLWSHRGGRLMGWEWTVLGGRGEGHPCVFSTFPAKTRGGKNWRSSVGWAFCCFLGEWWSWWRILYIFVWIVAEDVGFMKIWVCILEVCGCLVTVPFWRWLWVGGWWFWRGLVLVDWPWFGFV